MFWQVPCLQRFPFFDHGRSGPPITPQPPYHPLVQHNPHKVFRGKTPVQSSCHDLSQCASKRSTIDFLTTSTLWTFRILCPLSPLGVIPLNSFYFSLRSISVSTLPPIFGSPACPPFCTQPLTSHGPKFKYFEYIVETGVAFCSLTYFFYRH